MCIRDRILYLWDQDQGQVYNREDINRALKAYGEQNDRRAALNIVPSVDVSGHGTAAAAIAAGNGRGSDGVYRGEMCIRDSCECVWENRQSGCGGGTGSAAPL